MCSTPILYEVLSRAVFISVHLVCYHRNLSMFPLQTIHLKIKQKISTINNNNISCTQHYVENVIRPTNGVGIICMTKYSETAVEFIISVHIEKKILPTHKIFFFSFDCWNKKKTGRATLTFNLIVERKSLCNRK